MPKREPLAGKGPKPERKKVRQALEAAPKSHWAGFQIYYPMRESEVRGSTGLDLVESMLAVFREVTPAMNLCMQIELAEQSVTSVQPPGL